MGPHTREVDDGITDRGLRSHRQHAHIGAGFAPGIHRLVRGAAFRFGRVLRGAARLRRARPLGAAADGAHTRHQATLSRRHDDPGDGVLLRLRRGADHRFHADGPARKASRCDLVRIVEGLQGEVPVEMLLDVRFGYGKDTTLGHAVDDGVRFTAGPDTVVFRAPVATSRKGTRVLAYLNVKKGDRIPLQLNLHPSHEPVPPTLAVEDVLGVDRIVLARLGGPLHLRRPAARSGDAFAADAQGDDLRADRGHRRGADDVAAGGHRRRPQLGLSLLLDTGRQPDHRRAVDGRLP